MARVSKYTISNPGSLEVRRGFSPRLCSVVTNLYIGVKIINTDANMMQTFSFSAQGFGVKLSTLQYLDQFEFNRTQGYGSIWLG